MLSGTGRDSTRWRSSACCEAAPGQLRHPAIVAVHDVGQADGRYYFTMDLVEGAGLDVLLGLPDAAERFPLRRRIEVLADVAEALGSAHEQGIVHRDVKPSNIAVDRSGRVMLLDFGLARDASIAAEGLTVSGVLLGTPHYMAPEQASRSARSAGPPADVFSLGVVLYRCLTGELPSREMKSRPCSPRSGDDPVAPATRNPRVHRDLTPSASNASKRTPRNATRTAPPSPRPPALLAGDRSPPAGWAARSGVALTRRFAAPPRR